MQCGSVVLSLLLLATVGHSQFTLSAGVLAAGAAAAVGGFVGGAAIATLARGVGGRRGSSRGRSFGRGGGGFRRGRGRRAVLEPAAAEVEEAEEQSAVWGSVAAADSDGCALKLICLLEAADSTADGDEQTVLSFIGDLEGAKQMTVPTKLPYEAAGWVGKFRGAVACEVAYGSLCPYNKADMMQLVSSIWSGMATEEANTDVASA